MPDVDTDVWETTDLGTAAYAMTRGLAFLGAKRAERRAGEARKFVFQFSDPDRVGRRLQIDYVNSPERTFDEAMRSLKKVCYD